MKSGIYTLPFSAISFIAALCTAMPTAKACGPFFPDIPSPKFFTSAIDGTTSGDIDREENLRLWQQLTSAEIPLADIGQVLYADEHYDPESTPDNLFYAYIHNTNDREIEQFLRMAKEIERRRDEIASPWYYPEAHYKENGEFTDIIADCKAYRGSRLYDRYALQLVRAQFAARDYAGCVASFNERLGSLPASNLMKRMAMKYVAGCWSRLGDADKANEFFAKAGDFGSLAHHDAAAFMAARNPDCPELMAYIQTCSTDSARFCALRPVARRVLRDKKAANLGDWKFVLAYEAGEFHADYTTASRHIADALRSKFSSQDFRDHARAYRMKVDAALGRRATLLADLRWIEGKMDRLTPDASEWGRILQNIVYSHWVPTLWQQHDYATAILLCGYADNLIASRQRHTVWVSSHNRSYLVPETELLSIPLTEMRKSRKYYNSLDYSSPSFRLMNSLTSSQLIAVVRSMSTDTPLYRHLLTFARTDAPYLDELIGTIALREERYARAAEYLGRVPRQHLATLNVYKDGSLQVNPFCAFPGHWRDFDSIASPLRAKYHFACRMLHYRQIMRHGKTPDERGLARLKYAIARRNSFIGCWALTQYWHGCVTSLFMPSYDSGYHDLLDTFPALYDFEADGGHEAAQAIFDREVRAALAMLTTDAARAEAEYLLFHLRTIVARYPDTPTAHAVKSACDRWPHWL